MSRSRSMEAISDGGTGEDSFPEQNQPTLFTRRKLPGPHTEVKRPERPRTALANMRPPAGSGRRQDPEFEKRSSGQGGEPEQNDRKPLVLSRTIFEKIRNAAKVFTSEERARQKQVIFRCMLTLESRRFPVLGEVSFC